MSQMTGADADALDAAAEQLTLAADELDASASSLASTLGAVRWLGAVSIRFSDLWSSQHNPRMSKTSGFLRDAARDLRGQASDQRRAAESNGSPRTAPVAAAIAPGVTAPKPGRLETDAARQAILKRADTMLKNDRYLTQFPGAMAEVRRWRDSFGDRVPTEAEAAQFERYLAAIVMANYQVRIVTDAATLAMNEFTAMAESAEDAATGAMSVASGGDGIGRVPGAILGFAGDLIDGAVDSEIKGPLIDGAVSLTADQLGAVAASNMDAQLAAMAGQAHSTEVTMHNNPFAVAFTGYQASASQIEVAQATGDIAEAFSLLTGDGSVVDSALRNSLSALPGLGQTVSGVMDIGAIAGSSAQAQYHYEAGMMALEVAMGGMQNFANFTNNVVDISPSGTAG